jgi:type II secretion system protein N
MKTAGRAAVVGAVFTALLVFFLARLFPADVVARTLLARLPPAWPSVVFQSARLGLGAIELADVTLRSPDGRALVTAPRVAFRPSLLGLWSRAGLPWRIDATVCGGEGEALVTGERTPEALTLGWRDVDLGACPPLAVTGSALAGRAELAARVALVPEPAGEGTVEVHGAAWRTDVGPLVMLGSLHAERALVRWHLAAGRLDLTSLELHGPEVSAEGTGAVRLADPFDSSGLEVRVAIQAAPGAPDRVRALLAMLPGATPDAPRRMFVHGTLARPAVMAIP